jgi:hypothetical protein
MSIFIKTLEENKKLRAVNLFTEKLSLIAFDKKRNLFSKHK